MTNGNTEFTMSLGSGLYMNNRGELLHGRAPDRPSYPVAGASLPTTQQTLEKTLSKIKKAMPDPENPKTAEKLLRLGVPQELIDLLGMAGQLAGTLASVIPIVGAVFAVANMLGLFKDEPNPLETLINTRFNELQRQVAALAAKLSATEIVKLRNTIEAGLIFAKRTYDTLRSGNLDYGRVLTLMQDLRNNIKDVDVAVKTLLDPPIYLTSFDQHEHKWVWLWIQRQLYLFPSTGPVRAVMPSQASFQFDHRLLVPLAVYAVETFLTMIKLASPEFRSTGEYKDSLNKIGNRLEAELTNMQGSVLARTVYTERDFTFERQIGLYEYEVIDDLPPLPPVIAPWCTRFCVGALDLWNHNDSFFGPGFTIYGSSHVGYPGIRHPPEIAPAKVGLLNVRWIPPATLEKFTTEGGRTGYSITNPAECAAAANAQAEADYADLLISSGYTTLAHLLATVCHCETEPDRSETVTGGAKVHRMPLESQSTSVESRLVGKSSAERQPQDVQSFSWFTTQPLNRERMLNYRIMLRTLDDEIRNGMDDYNSFYHTTYEYPGDPPGDPPKPEHLKNYDVLKTYTT